MTRATQWASAIGLAWAALASPAFASPALTSPALTSPALAADRDDEALQVLADVTAIDSECGTVNAVFGLVFAYAAAHGVATVDILPLGRRRAEFEAALRRRIDSTAHEALCGEVLDGYRKAFPDWFTTR